jgi:ribosomal protein S18 acetylase RimI-like enzyme
MYAFFIILLSFFCSVQAAYIRIATQQDLAQLKALHLAVAQQAGGIARKPYEITDQYVATIVNRAQTRGIMLIAEINKSIVGSIHGYQLELQVFSHVFGEITIAVHPAFQHQGIGRQLFTQLLEYITCNCSHILRVEAMTRESNTKARTFYASLGFIEEARLEKRIQSVNGGFEADIPIVWFNPHFQDVSKILKMDAALTVP